MKRTLSCLLAAATIAAASVATTTDASAQLAGTRWRLARGMEGRLMKARSAAGVVGGAVIAGVIIASRPQGYVVYPRLLLGISAGLRRLRVVGYTGERKFTAKKGSSAFVLPVGSGPGLKPDQLIPILTLDNQVAQSRRAIDMIFQG